MKSRSVRRELRPTSQSSLRSQKSKATNSSLPVDTYPIEPSAILWDCVVKVLRGKLIAPFGMAR
jgi:hypothetical protein